MERKGERRVRVRRRKRIIEITGGSFKLEVSIVQLLLVVLVVWTLLVYLF